MMINKKDCKFNIIQHNRIPSSLNLFKKIEVDITLDNEIFKYVFTNAGLIPIGDQSWFCAKKFYEHEAKQFILNLPDKILI